jgi:hypothetical protein
MRLIALSLDKSMRLIALSLDVRVERSPLTIASVAAS